MPKQERACMLKRYDITAANLPLSCPMPNMRLWDAHPRVFLPIEETGHVKCPYCEAEYFLINAEGEANPKKTDDHD